MTQLRLTTFFWKRLCDSAVRLHSQERLRSARLAIRPLGLIRVGFLALAVCSVAFSLRVHAAQAALASQLAHLLPSAERAFDSWAHSTHRAPSAIVELNGVRVSLRLREDERPGAELRRDFHGECPSGVLLAGSVFDSPSETRRNSVSTGATDIEPDVMRPRSMGTSSTGPSLPEPSFTGACLKDAEGQPISILSWVSHPFEPKDLNDLSVNVLFSQELAPQKHDPKEGGALPVSRVLELDISLRSFQSAFPKHGNAPGFDPSFAPRPQGRRLLSARLETSSPGTPLDLAFTYEVKGPPEVAFSEYARQLDMTVVRAVRQAQGSRGGMFRKGDTLFAITATPNMEGSLLTLVRLP